MMSVGAASPVPGQRGRPVEEPLECLVCVPGGTGASDSVVSTVAHSTAFICYITECQTVQGLACVFPFKFQGVRYNSCTSDGSSNGAAWCATQVYQGDRQRAGRVTG